MKTMEGVVTIVQESRFQLTDDQGASHLFILGHDTLGRTRPARAAAARPGAGAASATPMPRNIIGLIAHSVAPTG